VIVPGSQHGFQARRRSVKERRVFVLDTNVLMHDPAAIFRFQEHDVFLPMVVLEELDAAKKGVSEVARNVRQATRMLDDLVERDDAEDIEHGIALPAANGETPPGRVFFQTQTVPDTLPETLPGTRPDNSILGTAMALQAQRSDATVILVSKDINLRIKARVLGILSEDYYEDLVLEDVNLLYGGTAALDPRYWATGPSRPTCSTRGRRRDGHSTSWRAPRPSRGTPTSVCTVPARMVSRRSCAAWRAGAERSSSHTTTSHHAARCGASAPATASRASP
jgi:hypothetical protein